MGKEKPVAGRLEKRNRGAGRPKISQSSVRTGEDRAHYVRGFRAVGMGTEEGSIGLTKKGQKGRAGKGPAQVIK